MAEEATNPYGYGDVDKVQPMKGGKYLSFKAGDKGKIIQLRLVSEPRYIINHWITAPNGKQTPTECGGKDCGYCGEQIPQKERLEKVAKWGWIVLHRTEEGSSVKMFTGPTLIARHIKDISELKNQVTKAILWGDPTKFDIQIERTEMPGENYYKVTPVPDTKGELTEAEQKMIAEANINLEEELANSKKSDNTGAYGAGKAPDMETVPEEEVNPDDIPADLGEDEKDPIPF